MGSGGKKKHQREFTDPSSSSSEGSEAEECAPKCSHLGPSVREADVRKSLRPSYIRIGGICRDCKRAKSSGESAFLCLACGSQLCQAHRETHGKASRSSSVEHCVYLHLKDWNVSCSSCALSSISPNSSKRLRDVHDFVKRARDNQAKNKMTPLANPSKLPKVRGLTNLGNTCFFNSVMQCLSQSHPLLHILDLHSQIGAPFKTNTLNLQLQDPGALTFSLVAFLKEMNSMGKTQVYNPSQLFGRICNRSPQFKALQQEDSHELLRNLLEIVKSEEVNRQKTAVLKHYGLTDKASRAAISASLRKTLQSLNRYTNHTVVDRLFGGQLVSTILCEVCHNSSQIFEPFLDISLPLIEEKYSRLHSNKFEDEEISSSLSCFGGKKKLNSSPQNKSQLKKERNRAKKDRRKLNKDIKGKNNGLIENNNEEENPENDITIEKKVNGLNDAEVSAEESISQPAVKAPLENNKNEKFKKLPRVKESNETKKLLTKLGPKDGDEEDDEDDGYSEEDEGWEWDEEGEEWEEGDASTEKKEEKSEALEEYKSDVQAKDIVPPKSHSPLRSLNPLKPEILAEAQLIESSEREKSADVTDKSGDSSNADIEDNLDNQKPRNNHSSKAFDVNDESFHPDPLHLDPRMQKLSRKVRRLSVSAATFEETSEKAQQEYTVTLDDNGAEGVEDEQSRIQNDWIARSLTSIAPRYTSKYAGECSIYSCLTQFTAPELLTGNNKWACDKCTRVQNAKRFNDTTKANSSDEEESSSPVKTVYSNASKQLLIFSPPFVLTLHLKRFQQTTCSLRKLNKYVDFPLVLDLAPFCSSAAASTPTVNARQESIKYYLFALIEHAGRLHGGHYTAYIKVRPRDCTRDFSQFYSSPDVKNDEIKSLLLEIERKYKESNATVGNSVKSADSTKDSETPPEPYKWYHVSDSDVVEVSEEKVLKSQAYILFYERFV